MAAFVLLLLILAMTGHSVDATWCACRPEADSTALQKAIDYACGNGADCTAIQTNGPCFQPNTMRAHCNYAVNSYFQRKGQSKEACIFSNTAATTQIDPGTSGACIYPSTGSSTPGGSTTPGGTSTTPGGTSTTPGGNTGISPPGGISSPSAFNSPPGGFNTGGAGFGLGPSSINTDSSAGVSLLSKTELLVTLLVLTLLVFIQG